MLYLLLRYFSAVASFVRKWLPAAAFLGLGLALLAGPDKLHGFLAYLYGATATGSEMSAAELQAEAQASGWLPFALVTSKLLTTLGAFVLFAIGVWRLHRLIEPGAATWAKKGYAVAFDSLSDPEKFIEYRRGRWQLIALIAAAALFATLAK
jgi:hypothetical protein